MPARSLPIAGVLFLAVAAAAAQPAAMTVEISPFAGYLWGGQFFKAGNPFGKVEVRAADHLTYGLRFGYSVQPLLQIELQASRTKTSFLSNSSDLGRERLGELKIDSLIAYANIPFATGRFVPYLSLGAGASRLDPDLASSQFQFSRTTRFTGSVGLGAKARLADHVGIRADARGYAIRLGDTFFGVACRDISSDCDQRRWLTNAEATGGLVFAF
jgi:opacity protein-like surface antigen